MSPESQNIPEKETYIPYEATAENMAEASRTLQYVKEELVSFLSKNELAKLLGYLASDIHSGIETGIWLGDYNPISHLEAYRLGYIHGEEYVA